MSSKLPPTPFSSLADDDLFKKADASWTLRAPRRAFSPPRQMLSHSKDAANARTPPTHIIDLRSPSPSAITTSPMTKMRYKRDDNKHVEDDESEDDDDENDESRERTRSEVFHSLETLDVLSSLDTSSVERSSSTSTPRHLAARPLTPAPPTTPIPAISVDSTGNMFGRRPHTTFVPVPVNASEHPPAEWIALRQSRALSSSASSTTSSSSSKSSVSREGSAEGGGRVRATTKQEPSTSATATTTSAAAAANAAAAAAEAEATALRAEMARLEEHHSSACEALEAELAEEHRVARIEAIKHEVSVVDKEWK